ncbi:MAG: glycosyltransferase [Candidatus Moranbacteria bacterium CG10_big_fil_rev_8_21_14_0_10_35_21]|nr:MAG: glycosyltransferase [Candidatus Moranbacteria bacterium CG10_big_fil_rev_8_21_14_0_10_35_21]PJA89007.1 MAG: glycosyltransferase [Candidatus Moranbacteria bacterium CG_4_9_14_3_um_filter_36_9]
MNKKLISLVIPIYNEESNVPLLYKSLMNNLSKLNQYKFEIILINDGSQDKSLEIISKLIQEDQRVKLIDFSRNFGKEAATSAGCHLAKGNVVITMDADLQHPPELIQELIAKWREGHEVVYTVRKENQGASFTKKITSQIYWWIFNKISSVTSEPHSTDFRLMDRMVIETFKKLPERERLFRGLIDWMGYRRAKIYFTAPERHSGKVAYSYGKLFHLAINSITAFSLLPLRFAGYFGTFITVSSFLFFLSMLITRWFINPLLFTALAFVIVANTFLIGIVLISLGFIALYIARIHDEVIGRPLYIIRKKTNFNE